MVYHHGFAVANNYGSLVDSIIYDAEVFAILQSVKFVRKLDRISSREKVEIRTDCEAIARTLPKYVHTDSLMSQVKQELRLAWEEENKIEIRWIPGHKSIILAMKK